MTRVSIYSKDGLFIGDIRTAPIMEYILNADPRPGRCEFALSRNDEKVTQAYLEFGNIILIRHEKLPDWVGEIVRRTWSFGEVKILAYQSEHILEKRITPNQKLKGSAGALFTQILNLTNSAPYNNKPIFPGDVFVGGTSREETLGGSALDHITQLSERAGNDFDVYYKFDDNNHLRFVGNWYQQRGIVTNKYFREGHNIEISNNLLVEDARDLANYVEGRGDASTSGTRKTTVRYDDESLSQYGLYQTSNNFDGNKETATLEENTLNYLRTSRNPARSYDITALDVDDTYDYLDVGNVSSLDLNTSGFNQETQVTVRIYGMEFNSLENKVRMIVEEYAEPV